MLLYGSKNIILNNQQCGGGDGVEDCFEHGDEDGGEYGGEHGGEYGDISRFFSSTQSTMNPTSP